MTRRLFVAAWLHPAAAAELVGIVDRLTGVGEDVRWVPPENFHVTLRFLGDLPEERLEGLVTGLRGAYEGVAPFSMGLGGLGAFPARGAPRVLWAGVDRGVRELGELASRTEKALLARGFEEARDERPFRAHVTIGRPRGSRGSGRLRDLLEKLSFPGGTHLLEEVTLAESRLSPRGAKYEAVERFPFARGAPPPTHSP